jgi:hypothetical protein
MEPLHGSLVPAYGRDYQSAKEALAAWNEGKDFRIHTPQGSTYCSIRDMTDYPVGHTFQLRYFHRELVCVIQKLADGTWASNHDAESEKEDADYIANRT